MVLIVEHCIQNQLCFLLGVISVQIRVKGNLLWCIEGQPHFNIFLACQNDFALNALI